MPRLLLVACCLLCSLFGSLARADAPAETPRRDSMLLVQPFAARGGATVTYERVLDDRWRWGIGGGFSLLRNATSVGSDTQTSFLGNLYVVPGVDRYLTGRAPDGLFLGLRLPLAVAPAQMSTSPKPDVLFMAGADALLGYSVVLGQGFAAEVGFGVGVQYASLVTTTSSAPGGVLEGLTNRQITVGSRALASVGWAF